MKTNFLPLESFAAAVQQSHKSAVVLLKHSSTCSLCADVYDQLSQLGRDIYLVIVQKDRALSDEIEARTGVRHESPQILIMRDGKVTYTASHRAISAQAVLLAEKSGA